MNDHRNILTALLASLVLHCYGGYCLGRILDTGSSKVVMPEFKQGDVSVAVDVQMIKVPKEKQPEIKVEPDPVIEQPDPIVNEEPKKVEKPQQTSEPQVIQGVQTSISAISMSDVAPRYPFISRKRGEEGVVVLRIRIGRNGMAEKVDVVQSSGFSNLDESAKEASQKAHFIDDKGKPVNSGEANLSVRFRLEDR